MALAGVKVSFFEAAIFIASSVTGLRPSRAGYAFTVNLPKPGMDDSVSDPAASAIAANIASTISLAWVLVRPCSVSILSAISLVVVLSCPRVSRENPCPTDCRMSSMQRSRTASRPGFPHLPAPSYPVGPLSRATDGD